MPKMRILKKKLKIKSSAPKPMLAPGVWGSASRPPRCFFTYYSNVSAPFNYWRKRIKSITIVNAFLLFFLAPIFISNFSAVFIGGDAKIFLSPSAEYLSYVTVTALHII